MGGSVWELRPQLGELRDVRAGFDTGLGWFEGRARLDDDDVLNIELTVPVGSRGRIVVPKGVKRAAVNGETYVDEAVILIE
jgi:hypothetical protein